MNNRFKFRVAVKQGIEWRIYDVLYILHKLDGTIWVQVLSQTKTATFTAWLQVDGENVILEQCTGLTDKNGKLIYDGDVFEATVLNSFDGDSMVGERIRGQVAYFPDGTCFTFAAYAPSNLGQIEIIGNIHETEV
jgi:uncharacterized phage protein (TIGR01671 family)